MATAKLKFINLPLPRPTGADSTSKEGKIERSFQEWATQIVRALQTGTVEIPATEAAASAASATESPSSAALVASGVPGPIPAATPEGAAGGDLNGNYPNPQVVKIGGQTPGDAAFAKLADIYGNVSAMVSKVLPAGVVFQWPAALANIPGGFLLCDGTVYDIADYEILGALLGAKYGGDGVTTFGVPTTADIFVLGTTTDADVGTTGGTAQHKHAVGTLANDNESTHTHGSGSYVAAAQTFNGSLSTDSATAATPHLVAPDTTPTGVAGQQTATGTNAQSSVSGTSSAGSAHTHTITGKTDIAENLAGSTADEDVLPPWLKLAFIIKT